MSFWREQCDCFMEVLLPVLFLVFAFILVVAGPAYFFAKESCEQQTEHFESRFGLFTDCQVKVNGRWLQWDHYRATEETENE